MRYGTGFPCPSDPCSQSSADFIMVSYINFPSSIIFLECLLIQSSWLLSLHPSVMESHPLGNDISAWDSEEEVVVKQLDLRDHEHSKPTDEMIADAGYPAETHDVVTPDGYILRLHRIPHDRDGVYNNSRPLVFLMHGLLSSSADWVVTGPGAGLAFILSDEGYDVWLGNYRGNTYSHDHVNNSITKKEYWAFSWDEMAQYDLPTMIEHTLQVTGHKDLYYIGHSMGTITYYTACNYHPWIPEATKLMVGYGAHTVVPNMISPVISMMAYFADDIQSLLNYLGIYEFLPSNWLMEWWATKVCDENMVYLRICENLMFLVAGYNQNEMNTTMLPYILSHVPAGTSTMNMIHYAQSVNTGGWAGYDYGSEKLNMERWNATKPPNYRYDVITAPTVLFWAENDWLVVPKDEKYLASKLPNLVANYKVDEPAYTHLDFLWGVHNLKKVYGPTLDIMKQFS